MNTRTTAIVAILAVAAIAIAGVGYAAYWGQTDIVDNTVDSRYITVATDYPTITEKVDYNTKYSSTDKYIIEPNNYVTKTADTNGFEIGVSGHNLIPLTYSEDESTKARTLDSIAFTLQAPETFAASSYDFQVKIDNVEIGSKAILYFGYSATEDALPTASNLFRFYETEVDGTYVAVINAPAISTAAVGDDAVGFADTYYGYLFVEIDGTATSEVRSSITYNQMKIDDVNTAKVRLGNAGAETPVHSKIEFKAMVEPVGANKIIQQTISPALAKGTQSVITLGNDTASLDGFAVSVASATIAEIEAINVVQATANAGATVTFTSVNEAGDYYVLLKFTNANTGDSFYRVYEATFA